MNLKDIIQTVLDNNESLSMDSREDKKTLLEKLYKAIENHCTK